MVRFLEVSVIVSENIKARHPIGMSWPLGSLQIHTTALTISAIPYSFSFKLSLRKDGLMFNRASWASRGLASNLKIFHHKPTVFSSLFSICSVQFSCWLCSSLCLCEITRNRLESPFWLRNSVRGLSWENFYDKYRHLKDPITLLLIIGARHAIASHQERTVNGHASLRAFSYSTCCFSLWSGTHILLCGISLEVCCRLLIDEPRLTPT